MERGTSLPTLPTPKMVGMNEAPDDYLDYNFIKIPKTKKQFKLPLMTEGSSSESLHSSIDVNSSKKSSRRK